jgi:hypothetical protein
MSFAWGNKTTLSGLNTSLSETTNVDADYVASSHYTQWDTLNPGESVHIQCEAVMGSTGNDIYFRVITALDTTSEVADTQPITGIAVPFVASTTQRRAFTLSGVYKYRVECRKAGATAGTYTPNVYVRKNGGI